MVCIHLFNSPALGGNSGKGNIYIFSCYVLLREIFLTLDDMYIPGFTSDEISQPVTGYVTMETF